MGTSAERVDLSVAGTVRAEDAFDVGALARWLADCGADGVDPGVVPEVGQFIGGASNLTYLISYPERQLILRRPPPGTTARGAHDMGREYTIQSGLAWDFPYVPRMVARCEDPDVIGTDFYLMAKIDGLILRSDPPPEFALDQAAVRRLCTSFVDRLVALHGVDLTATGLDRLDRGVGYVGRQVAGWADRFRAAWTSNVPTFERTAGWLAAEQPRDAGRCLIHNDFRFDNVVLRDDDHEQIVGVLDWEMATVGDPLMDVGSALAYWAQADDDSTMLRLRRQPTHLPGMLTRDEVWDRYAERAGVDTAGRKFYEVFGLFRLAVIAQQIYQRFHRGQTDNPAYQGFHELVCYLHDRCERVVDGTLR